MVEIILILELKYKLWCLGPSINELAFIYESINKHTNPLTKTEISASCLSRIQHIQISDSELQNKSLNMYQNITKKTEGEL